MGKENKVISPYHLQNTKCQNLVNKKIEYASIGLSALGTVLAVATQKLVFVATPITISLSLSLINRQKELTRANTRLASLEQQSSSHINSTSEQIRTIQSSLRTLDSSPTIASFNDLRGTLITNQQEVSKIRTALVEVETINSEVPPLFTEIATIKDAIKQLESHFLTFKEDSSSTSTAHMLRLTGLDLDRSQIYSLITDIRSQIDALEKDSKTTDIYELRTESTAQMFRLEGLDLDRNKIYLQLTDIISRLNSLEGDISLSLIHISEPTRR
jgi:hypothetical protein